MGSVPRWYTFRSHYWYIIPCPSTHGAKSTLADANEKRDWRIFADFAHILIEQASVLYAADDFGVELKQATYALDSTTIDLCLSLFPWAKFRRRKAAVKLHTLLNLHGSIPTIVIITSGKVHDVNILDELPIEAGAFYIMDRGYMDFTRLHRIHGNGAFFVTRTKNNSRFHRRYSHPVKKSLGIRFDQSIILEGFYSHRGSSTPSLRPAGRGVPAAEDSDLYVARYLRVPCQFSLKSPTRNQEEPHI